MKTVLLIGAGSFLGGVLRYMVSKNFHQAPDSFPVATFLVNLIGCFCIGIAVSYFERSSISMEVQRSVTIGLLGGFTTFSAFSIESVNLFRNGFFMTAVAYILLSVIVGLAATYAGIKLSSNFLS